VKVRISALVALALAGFALGCGGSSDDKAEEAEHNANPQQAIAEIAAVRSGLAEALATYKAGDKSAADEQVGDTYLKHFEEVEGPLEEVDPELKEQLEDTIREELREQIRAGASAARVAALVREIDARLDEAKQALQS
jgi:hypothetical protein